MSSDSSSRRRFSDSQLHRDRANLLPEINSSSATAEQRGAFETIGHQLELEGKLHKLAQQLLQSYRETQQWASVGQLAQVLVTGSQRAGQLKQKLEGLRENSGGLFLESIRESSLPRDTPETEAANQSSLDQRHEKVDTVEAESSAEGACKIPACQDSPENVEQFEQASEQRSETYQSASYRQVDQLEAEDSFVSTLPTTAALLSTLPAAEQATAEPESANQNQEESEEAGVRLAYQLEVESVDSAEFVLADSGEDSGVAREGGLDVVVVEATEQPAIYREGKGNTDLNSSGVCSTNSEIPSSTSPPSFEDANVDALLVAIDTDTTADHTESNLEADAEKEIRNKGTSQETIPFTFEESNKSQSSRSPSPTFQTANEQTELIGDFNHIVEEEVATASSLKPDCNTGKPETSEEPTAVEIASSSECSESESKYLLAPLPTLLLPAGTDSVEGQAPLNTDDQQIVDTGETLVHVLSLGKTQSSTTDGLEASTSTSSIDRDLGIVDECLEELTLEIEALVTVSEVSSETSEQFFSPPESIIVEAEYDDAQQELEKEETIKPDQESALQENEETTEPAVNVNPVLVVEEKVVKEKEEKLTILTESVAVVQGQEEEKPAIFVEPVPSLLGEEEEQEEPVGPVVTLHKGREKPAAPAEPVVSLEVQPEENVTPAAQAEPAVVNIQEQVEEEEEIEQKPAILAEPVIEPKQEGEKRDILTDSVVIVQDREEGKEVLVADQGESLCEEEIEEDNVKPVDPREPVLTLKEEQLVVGNVVKEETTDSTSETEEEEPKDTKVQVEWDTSLSPEVAEIDELAPTKEEGELVSSLATEETAVESVATEKQERAEMEPSPNIIACPAVRYSVERSAFSDENKLGTALYLIIPAMDENGETRSAVRPSETVTHRFEDFLELQRKLLSLEQHSDGEEDPRDIPELELHGFSKENGQMVDQDGVSDELLSGKEEKVLEEFLNRIASNPRLRTETVVLNFLHPMPNEALPSTIAPAKQESAVEVEESDQVESDRAVSVEETPTKEGSLEKEVMSDLSLPAGNSVDHTDEAAAACQGEVLIGGYEILANGVEHIDQAGQCSQIGQSEESHSSGQPNQHSEHDHTDQLDQSDQQASLVKDKDEVARERDTNLVLVDEEPVPLQQLPDVEDSRATPSSSSAKEEDILQVTPSTDTTEAKTTTLDQKDQEVHILSDEKSEKSELFSGLASCDDFSVGKDQSPKPHETTTMTPTKQEVKTMKEWCPDERERKDGGISTTKNGRSMETGVDSLDSTALTGKVPPLEEKEVVHVSVPDQQSTRSSRDVSPVVAGIEPVQEEVQVRSSFAHERESVEGIEKDVLKDDEVESKKDASVVAPASLVEEAPPVCKDTSVENEKGPSLSDTHEKAPLSSWEDLETKPVGTSVADSTVSAPLNGGDESDLSPTHSERTSSNATSSSYLYTTDESTSPVKAVRQKPPIHRILSDPSLPTEEAMTQSMEEENDTFHMSLVPSRVLQHPGDGQNESESGKPKKVKRKGSMPLKIRSSINTVKRSFSTRKRGMTVDLDSEGVKNVSIMKPLTTQEWDPTCLLEELYSDYRQGLVTSTNPSGEAARHYGYLDKLPTNRKKANVMTKWKRRYFRAQEGKLYYYQDRTTTRALGFIHLTSARIDPIPEKMQLQIVPRDGKSIMIRTPNIDEFQTWHRAILLEAAHPTMVAPTSPKLAVENPTIIIDIGACSVRAGLVREENPYPEIFFPAVCSFDSESFELIECGYTALLPDNRIKAQQVYPRRASLRMDHQRAEMDLPLKAMDAMINTIVMQLDIDPQASQLIMTLPPTAPEKERDGLVDLLLGTFGFSGICLQDQTLLALYSYNTTTGVIVDIGNHIAVIPYIDGYAIESGITRLPYGGNAITESLTKLVTQKGMRYFSETEMFINRFIKESLCYVSQDYEEDCAKSEENTKDFIHVVDVDRFQLPDHRKIVTLDSALFKAPEGLFSPHLWGKDVPGLHEIVWKAIQACPIDHRRELAKKIYLSGGSSVLPGLKERLQKEISALAPTGVAIEVHINDDSCHHAAYCGASVLASLGSFQNCLVSYDDWTTVGVEALKKWTGS